MKRLVPFALALVASLAGAQDSMKFTQKTEATEKLKFALDMTFEIGGMTANMTTKVTQSSVVGAEKSTLKFEWEGFSIEAGGQAMDIPTSAVEATLDKEGLPTKATGGIEGSDSYRTFLATFYWVPTVEVKKGEALKGKIAANEAAGTREATITTTYQGVEKIDDKDAFKFEQKIAETEGLESTNTYWLNAAGELIKLDGKYSKLPVPVVGDDASGTVKIRRA